MENKIKDFDTFRSSIISESYTEEETLNEDATSDLVSALRRAACDPIADAIKYVIIGKDGTVMCQNAGEDSDKLSISIGNFAEAGYLSDRDGKEITDEKLCNDTYVIEINKKRTNLLIPFSKDQLKKLVDTWSKVLK